MKAKKSLRGPVGVVARIGKIQGAKTSWRGPGNVKIEAGED